MATLTSRVLPGLVATIVATTPALASTTPSQRSIHHTAGHVHRGAAVHHLRPWHVRHLAAPAQPAARTDAQAEASPPQAALIHNAAFINDGLPYGQPRWSQAGLASWYGGSRWSGQMTSSGARYDENQLTAAHASLPIGARVRVTMAHSERSVVVVITDRPGTHRRIIDLSRAAAAALGMLDAGVASVTLTPG